MVGIERQGNGTSFEEVYKGMIRRQACEKVELASRGLYETEGAQLRERHLQERLSLLRDFPQEEAALTHLGHLASSVEGARAILTALATPALASSEPEAEPSPSRDS